MAETAPTYYTRDDALRCWLNTSTLNFTLYFFRELYKRDFVVGEHHLRIAEALDRVTGGGDQFIFRAEKALRAAGHQI